MPPGSNIILNEVIAARGFFCMVIYAEYLFLENALTGGMILLLTGKISGIRCKIRHLIAGSMLCGVYSFILFWDTLNSFAALMIKIGFSAVLVFLVFHPKELRPFARITLVFYLVSFSMGGITIGMMYFLGIMGVTQNTSIYLGTKGYLLLLPGCIMAWLIFSFFAEFIKRRLTRERTYTDVEIELEGRSVVMRGMVDTGNFLVDPLSGKPVMVISEAAAKQILPEEFVEAAVKEDRTQIISEVLQNSSYAGRIRMIPYHTVGKGRGSLVGIRTDGVRVGIHNGKGGEKTMKISEGAILAICGGMFSGGQSEDGCSVLLHPSMIEGGIAYDV